MRAKLFSVERRRGGRGGWRNLKVTERAHKGTSHTNTASLVSESLLSPHLGLGLVLAMVTGLGHGHGYERGNNNGANENTDALVKFSLVFECIFHRQTPSLNHYLTRCALQP